MKTLRLHLPVLIILAVLSSCSQDPEGYAVLLWPATDSALEAGRVLDVLGESEIDESIRVRDGEAESTVEQWRVLRFDERAAATTYTEAFAEWGETYGRSLRTALPVRERPDRTSTRVYRLRDGELIKIIGREAEESDEAGFVDYWYQVLTREGISGWVFGYYMELTGASGRALDPEEEFDGTDRIVRDIADTTWRPAYFAEMVASGRIDLEDFSSRYGLFGDTENNRFRLVLPGLERAFEYTGYYSNDGRTIEFEGTDLTITLSAEDRISVRYVANGRQRSNDFIIFTQEIPVILEAEQERRIALLEQFLQRGSGLVSTAYGTVQITDRGAITWNGYERLVPGVLPQSFNGSGRFDFGLYLNDELRGRYDGAIQLVGSGTEVGFLYSFTEDGVRFVFVPPRLVDDAGVMTQEPISPVVIFFRFITG